MKFKLNEHPSVWLFLTSLVILGISIFLNVLYQWKIYSLIAVILAGIAVLVLGYSLVKDLLLFAKEKEKYDATHPEEKEDDDKW